MEIRFQGKTYGELQKRRLYTPENSSSSITTVDYFVLLYNFLLHDAYE